MLTRVISSLFMMVLALPAFAQDVATTTATESWGKFLGAGLAIGLAVLGGASGQGKAAASAYEGIGRNPQTAEKMFTPLLIGLALIEFQTIMAFLIAILILNK